MPGFVIDARLPTIAEGGALVQCRWQLDRYPRCLGRDGARPSPSPAATIARVVADHRGPRAISPAATSGSDCSASRLAAAGRRRDTAQARCGVTLDPAGPAKAAGILQGDIIVRLGGSAVTGPCAASTNSSDPMRWGKKNGSPISSGAGVHKNRRRHHRAASTGPDL